MQNPDEGKICTKCKEPKNISEFTFDRGQKSGVRPNCKNCSRLQYLNNRDKRLEYNKKYVLENKDRVRAYHKNYKASKKDEHRNSDLIRKYGITLDEYNALLFSQNGKCAICNVEGAMLCVDHSHATGKVRGLLCQKCNTMIGQAKESTNNLRSAALYLESHLG
jgi:hypothetical protein